MQLGNLVRSTAAGAAVVAVAVVLLLPLMVVVLIVVQVTYVRRVLGHEISVAGQHGAS